MSDLEEFHCELCDCTFYARIALEDENKPVYCPLCGEPLDADEL